VPVRIDDCLPPLGFRQYQTIDLPHGRTNAATIGKIDDAVRALGAAGADRPQDAKKIATSRRGLLVGTGAAAIIAAGGGGTYWYRRSKRERVQPEVAALLSQAKGLLNQNTREGQYQAIGMYRRVVEIAPGYADGWGWLGYAYAIVSHFRDRQESIALRARAEAAGNRALELDPDSAMGELALSVALPFIGHWSARDRHLSRAMSLDPQNDEIRIVQAVTLMFVGRSTEALPLYARVRKKRTLTPAEYNNYIIALWNTGQLPELDQAVNDAASLYPTQSSIWFTRIGMAMYNGQFDALKMLAEDQQSRPSGIPQAMVDRFLTAARAIQTGNPADVDLAMAEQLADARQSATQAEVAIRNAGAMGRIDDAFAIADAYYFGRGFVIPDYPTPGSSFSPEQRQTRFLFRPVTKGMRADPRFEALVRTLGLDRYWRESKKPPDYRHIPGL
jgi:tetratricopeptide (TPR) repeat protein